MNKYILQIHETDAFTKEFDKLAGERERQELYRFLEASRWPEM